MNTLEKIQSFNPLLIGERAQRKITVYENLPFPVSTPF